MLPEHAPSKRRSITIYIPILNGGGIERLQLDLAPLFIVAGFDVTFLLGTMKGILSGQVSATARVVSLEAPRQLASLIPLIRYLRRDRPDIFLVHTEHAAIISLWAKFIARTGTRIVVCQHNTASAQSKRRGWQFRMLLILFRRFLNWADRIVAVSGGVADDLAVSCGIPRERIRVIYNGVVGNDFAAKSAIPIEHRWFGAGIPVIVAAGRLVPQKDFATLITAFASVVCQRDARLVVLGEGPLRASLTDLAQSLGIADRVDMPGFMANPLPYMRAAAVVVLSSRFEGFAMVLAEALACGTPVVSTDCPHGPAEILDNGRYGRLTPVGEPEPLAQAILETLTDHPSRDGLARRGHDFTVRASADCYLELFDEMLGTAVPDANAR